MKQFAFAGVAVLALAVASRAAEPVKSGLQVGESLPGAFHPFNATGAHSGEKHCLVCANGLNPVAMIFAREVSPALTTLIKKIDEATEKNASRRMGSFVVFCTDADEEKLTKELRQLARKEKLSNIVLSIDDPAGPDDYKVAREADITVVLYTNFDVKANHAFRKGELKDADIEKIVADVAKIVK
jgi:hypothetical protein